jgi:hypothetical protein
MKMKWRYVHLKGLWLPRGLAFKNSKLVSSGCDLKELILRIITYFVYEAQPIFFRVGFS